MTGRLINGFITASGYALSGGGNANEHWVAETSQAPQEPLQGATRKVFARFDAFGRNFNAANVWLDALEKDGDELDKLTDYVLSKRAGLMVRLAVTLEEVGRFDQKYGLSPIMLLHRLGLLENAVIVSGVWLDKDDVSLMRQENASLVLLPSCDLGSGNGIPPLVSFLNAGLNLRLGTGDCRLNPTGNMYREAYLLKMAVAANMNREDAVSDAALAEMLTGSDENTDEIMRRVYGL